ncbi:MAG: hypothetical protein JO069_00455 [Verrucomicrobia bacterium]|nr:hypothetical protein [Verrucomicrobiota bacterium]
MKSPTCFFAFCIALTASISAQAQSQYALQDLGTLPGYRDLGFASASPSSSDISATAYDLQKAGSRAVLYRQGRWIDLTSRFAPPNTFAEARATGVNPFGVVAGWFSVATDPAQGFVLSRSGALQTFQAFGQPTTVVGINAWGVIAGYYQTDAERVFIRQANGAIVDLGNFGAPHAFARAINDAGQVLVQLTDDYDTYDITLVVSSGTGATRTLQGLGGQHTVGSALNSFGQSVGDSELANGAVHAFYDDGANTHDLGTLPGGYFSEANGVNDTGVVVGHGDDANGNVHGWVFSNGRMIDLNELTVPTAQHWTIEEADAVNASGQIVAIATNPSLTTTILRRTGPNTTVPVTYPDYHVVTLTPVQSSKAARSRN